MAMIQDWRVSFEATAVEVRAENWLSALAMGLPQVGLDLGEMGRLVCATEPDGSAIARDPRSGKEVRVEPLGAAVPPSFEMPMSSFASVNVPFLRIPPPTEVPPPEPEEGEEEHEPPTLSHDPPALRLQPPARVPAPREAQSVEARAEPTFESPERELTGVQIDTPPLREVHLEDGPFDDLQHDEPTLPPRRIEPPPRIIPPPASLTVEREGPGRLVLPAAAKLDDRLEELFMRLGEILDAGDPAAACAVALRLANELIPCDAGAILVRTRAGDALRFRAALGPAAAAVLDTTIPLDRGIAGFVFQLGVALTIADARADNRHYARVDRSTGYHTRTLLAAPVRADDGGVYGVLELLNPPRPFSDDDLELGSRVAATLGSYFQGMHQ